MDENEKVKLAIKAIVKGWDFETLKYGDDLYGKESEAVSVWEYVETCKRIGTGAFNARYL
jgi:hypothetical protein